MTTDCEAMMPVEPITIGTFVRFLVGSREAILRVARCPQALWLGLVFVLATGFAREYDGADLWHEPWHLGLPLVASLGTSLVLYLLVYMVATSHGLPDFKFRSGYRTLLTFYWLTAPLAWLYAIPVERFLSPGDATAANLWFLAAVSVWRVLLITRALSVWLGASFVAMFFLVMLFADSVAVTLAFVSPQPIFNIMGGIRLSEPDRVVLDALVMVQILGTLSWLGWLVAAAIALAVAKSPWTLAAERSSVGCITKPLWGLAAALLVLGFALLPIGQPEQRHAYEAARLLRANEVEAAVEYMARFPRDAFPPIWDPPPRVGYGEKTPATMEVLAIMVPRNAPSWLGKIYIDKLSQNPLEAFQEVLPNGEQADATRFKQLLAAYEQFVPVDSLEQEQWRDLQGIAGQLEPPYRKRLRDYLNARKDQ